MAPKSARKQTPSIISPDSNGSLTPEGLMMMSPSLAALQAKYGNAEIVDTAPDIWAPKQDEQGMSGEMHAQRAVLCPLPEGADAASACP